MKIQIITIGLGLWLAFVGLCRAQSIFNLTEMTTGADGDVMALVDISDAAQSANGSTRKMTLLNLKTYMGSGLAAGADTQIQYNNASAFGAVAELTYANATGLLTYAPTLDEATGNEVALNFPIVVNKATSGTATGIEMDITDTASPGVVEFLDFKLNANSNFVVNTQGTITSQSGRLEYSDAANAYLDISSGVFTVGNGGSGVGVFSNANRLAIQEDAPYEWSSSTTSANSALNPGDLKLSRRTTSTLAIHADDVSTVGGYDQCGLEVYNYGNAITTGNVERGFARWVDATPDVFQIGIEHAGTGIAGELELVNTLDAATGNDVGIRADVVVNKATSGNYSAFVVDATETSAPGTDDRLLDLQVGGTSKFRVSNGGAASSVDGGSTLGAAATTFAATSNFAVMTGDAGANTIATITGGIAGQQLVILFVDALITITDDNSHAANSVDLSAAFTSADDTTLTLISDGTSWYELSRSTN